MSIQEYVLVKFTVYVSIYAIYVLLDKKMLVGWRSLFITIRTPLKPNNIYAGKSMQMPSHFNCPPLKYEHLCVNVLIF